VNRLHTEPARSQEQQNESPAATLHGVHSTTPETVRKKISESPVPLRLKEEFHRKSCNWFCGHTLVPRL
jgi:hypothetical protein